MNLLDVVAKERTKGFLSDALDPIHEALERLYPSHELAVAYGLNRLHLLYLPFQHKDRETGELTGRAFPLPHGDALKEWMYLEGELAGWNWDEIKQTTLAQGDRSARQQRFPPRDPPFPVTHWPVALPEPTREFPSIDVIDGGWISLFTFEESIPRACWILFVNEIPKELWIDAIVILVEHHIRLDRLAHLSEALETNERITAAMLSQKKGVAYLKALVELTSLSGVQDRRDFRKSLSKVLATVRRTPFFTEEQNWEILKSQKKELVAAWKRLEGPDRRYRKEAARYLRPLVRDLFDFFYGNLRRILKNNSSVFIDTERLPPWLVSAPNLRSGATTSGRAIYELIGDLVRFFYQWTHFKKFESGIEPPEWRGDTSWSGVPDEAREQLAAIGKKWRKEFGNRVRMINT